MRDSAESASLATEAYTIVRQRILRGDIVLGQVISRRKLAAEFSLPKDVVSYLVTNAQSTKDELYRIVARELRGFLEGLNLSQELAKLLTTLSFEIKMEARFIPNDEAVAGIKPDLKKKVTIKRKDGKDVKDEKEKPEKDE